MSKKRSGMLGVGGQRSNLSRGSLRGGGTAAGQSNEQSAADYKKQLARKMRQRATSADPAPEQ
jgi:uncharacterized protein DUF6243